MIPYDFSKYLFNNSYFKSWSILEESWRENSEIRNIQFCVKSNDLTHFKGMCALAEAGIQRVAKSINNENQKTCTVLASSQNLAFLDLSNLQTEGINHYHMILSIFQKIIASLLLLPSMDKVQTFWIKQCFSYIICFWCYIIHSWVKGNGRYALFFNIILILFITRNNTGTIQSTFALKQLKN